ncbi:MAG: carboxyl-terminal processing protease [Gemmatales bacterium]|nr:MAG: carboxyl-terminal processing protease [Gemmatales bacterium]
MKRRFVVLFVLVFLGLAASVRAEVSLQEVLHQAREHERQNDWERACAFYAYALTQDRTQPEIKRKFKTCLRHFHRVRRYQDASFRDQVLMISARDALLLYEEVLKQIRREYATESAAQFASLYRNSVDEIRLSLRDPAFRKEFVSTASQASIEDVLRRLSDWHARPVKTLADARRYVFRIALMLEKQIGLKPTVAILEMTCGACNSLDEHTYYLTPSDIQNDRAALQGQMVGIGVELAFSNQGIVISQVFTGSPAAQAGLFQGDLLLAIDGQPVAKNAHLNDVAQQLLGKVGSMVRLDVESRGQKRSVSLVRVPVHTSVAEVRMIDMNAGIGYIHLIGFHQNTLAELNTAIENLADQGMKALVLDLRGNAGGLFQSAVQVAERFLPEGSFIVDTQGKHSQTRYVSQNPAPLTVPLVVLVDGSTSSAAEVLAAALKENRRATLVGQPTYGKGTVQHLIEWKTVQAGGIRITWARLLSPLQNDFNGIGISPDVAVPRGGDFDEQLLEAQNLAREQVLMPR